MHEQPSPAPELEPQGFFSGIRPLAVVIGALVDNVATLLLSLLLLSIVASSYGESLGELDEPALQALSRDPGVLVSSMLLGSFCTGFGGFMAARIAACHRARHGAFVGLFAVAMGLVSYGSGTAAPHVPLWYDLLGFGLLVPVGALGGWISSLTTSAEPD